MMHNVQSKVLANLSHNRFPPQTADVGFRGQVGLNTLSDALHPHSHRLAQPNRVASEAA
jgi:hypothetical protein